MKIRAQLMQIPCVSFAARARMASGNGALTPIEMVGLKAIGHGLDDVDSLAQVLGIGSRPTLDLIYDFWLRGYVIVDTARARVQLASEAARAFKKGNLDTLSTAENNIDLVPLVQELVTGAVLPHVGNARPSGPESSLVPTVHSGLTLELVTRSDLLDAVQAEVERQSRRLGRDMAVQEAWVEPDQILAEAARPGAPTQQRRFLSVWADVRLDPDSARLLFDIVEAPELTPPQRSLMSRGLSRLAERLPDQLFFKRLQQEFERSRSDESSSGSEAALTRLTRTAAKLDGTNRGLVEQRQEQLAILLREACHEVRADHRARAHVRVVTGYSQHEAEIHRLLLSAQRQIVLGNPWLRLDPLLDPVLDGKSWFDLLESALDRGVQVFLLWGIAKDSILDAPVRNALMDLSARYPHRLIFSRKPAILHAKILVRDAHEALVTSYNFLDPPRSRESLELGVIVDGPTEDVAPESVLGLLEWCRDRYPDHVPSQQMLLLPQELGAKDIDLPELLSPPELPCSTDQQSAPSEPAIRHWERAWRAVAEHLVAVSRTAGLQAELLIDGEHRDELWRSLRNSTRRLAVLSDRLSVDVVTDSFVRTLRTQLDADIPCTFLFRREGASDLDDGPAIRLRREAQRVPELCRLVEGKSHAKVVVSDDIVTVGSFNFLSYGGEYGTAGQDRAELSIRVQDADVVEQVLSALHDEWPGSFEALVGRSCHETGDIPIDVPPRLQRLFASLRSPMNTGPVLLKWFEESATPWEDLAALEQAGVATGTLHRAAAAAIATAEDVDVEQARKWRARLALDRWQQQDFVGALLLAPVPNAGEPSLPSWLLCLGASIQGAKVERDILPKDSGQLAGPRAVAAAWLVMVGVLQQNRFELIDSLDRLGPVLTGTQAGWPAAIRRYLQSTSYQALPMDLLKGRAARRERLQEIAKAKEAFLKALVSAENVGFKFKVGAHTWSLLKSEWRFLGTLRRALDMDDVSTLARYLDSLEGTSWSLETMLDEASSEMRDEHNDRIDDPKRRSCLDRLGDAKASASEWIRVSRAGLQSTQDARILEACMELRNALTEPGQSEDFEVDAVAGPAIRFCRHLLSPLLELEAL